MVRCTHIGNGEVEISLDEADTPARARVTHVGPPPREQPGQGCLVLMTVEHVATSLLKLRLATGTELEVSPLHPLFVERRGWVFARDLSAGQLLRSDRGPIRLEAVEQARSNQRVFNLEVGLEHTYRVSADRVWAHNTSPIPRFTPKIKSIAQPIARGPDIRKVDVLVKRFGGKEALWKKMKT